MVLTAQKHNAGHELLLRLTPLQAGRPDHDTFSGASFPLGCNLHGNMRVCSVSGRSARACRHISQRAPAGRCWQLPAHIVRRCCQLNRDYELNLVGDTGGTVRYHTTFSYATLAIHCSHQLPSKSSVSLTQLPQGLLFDRWNARVTVQGFGYQCCMLT